MIEIDSQGSRVTSRRPRTWPVGLLLVALDIALIAFTSPNEGFLRWGFLDSGADLSIRAMIRRGLRPTIDFGYIYGLLPLSLTDLWQSLFGATPRACLIASLLCHLVLIWGFARLFSILRLGLPGLLLIVAAMPDILLISKVVLVHVLEPALLINAIAFQASGRRSTALALATACLFVKPAMGYPYGLVLLITMLLVEGRKAWRLLIPAAVTGMTLSAGLAAIYGPNILAKTLLPGAGMAVYRAHQFGFFNAAGRLFWVIPGGGLRDYFRYEVGSWIVGGIVLAAFGLRSLTRFIRREGRRRDEVVLTCAILHTVFVLVFFGHRFSWLYYYSILIAGVAAVGGREEPTNRESDDANPASEESSSPSSVPTDREKNRGIELITRNASMMTRRAIVLGLALIILVGGKVKTLENAKLWRINHASAETYGLYADDSQRAEWLEVLKLTNDSRPVALLSECEGITVIAPGIFHPPDCSYLVPGHPVPAEIGRKAASIAASRMVVTTREPEWYAKWPELTAALDGCRPVKKSGMFWVLRRERPPSSLLGRETPP